MKEEIKHNFTKGRKSILQDIRREFIFYSFLSQNLSDLRRLGSGI
ncbi:hypothetical protein LEP1GSC072_1887 [Leptospira noguchii str. Bonito]|nr:hypothetical protein LEP1GSC072_1887 [Leptospira noguchii str. Bonito]